MQLLSHIAVKLARLSQIAIKLASCPFCIARPVSVWITQEKDAGAANAASFEAVHE